MRRNGPYQIVSSRQVYKNPWMVVREDKIIHPDGKKGIFGVIEKGDGISILALDKEKNVYLNREYFYAIEQEALALPSGGVDEGESPLTAAKRELLEETGLASDNWIDLGMVQLSLRTIKSRQYLFLATKVEQAEPVADKTIERVKIPWKEVVLMVTNGQISHAQSCVAILRAKEIIKHRKI